jgi:hypothetical protein
MRGFGSSFYAPRVQATEVNGTIPVPRSCWLHQNLMLLENFQKFSSIGRSFPLQDASEGMPERLAFHPTNLRAV